MYLRLSSAALIASLITPCLSNATPQKCDGASLPPIDAPQEIKVSIASVEFQGGDALPDEIRTQLIRNVEKQEFSIVPGAPDTDWVSELNEVVVREVLAKEGYFMAQTQTTPYLIRAEAHLLRYAVRIEVKSGLQYRLGKVQFVDVTAFTQDDLRKEARLATGEIFDVAKIREAIESIVKLYSARGYIDATVEPQLNIDDEKPEIDLVMKLSEEAQYRVGAIEILGGEEKTMSRLVALLEPGEIFDGTMLRSFFEENPSLRLNGASLEQNVKIRRRTRDRRVDITLDVRSKGCTDSATVF
jgi:outer membrane protein assembly factor BamA